ncbi:MAG TPA: tetratricopeptide repeat protein [Acidobacteriaceae bacterium]|nr:tetratricopeptide repeat protein [Acidobacteriaceae bacterium]
MRRTAWLACMWLLCAPILAQDAQAPDVKAQDAKAQAMYEKQDYLGALPLYEDLHTRVPSSTLFAERLAMCLLGKAGTQDDADAAATRKRAKELLLQAKAGGDNSNLMQILLEKMNAAEGSTQPAVHPPGYEWLQKAEVNFSSGDMAGALENYKKALEVNPQFYEAALFAGDTEYKMGHPAEAGTWFARAIAIDPDRETAYRYWGDTLEKAGSHEHAEEEFIAAIVAEPYTRASRIGLAQWANVNHSRVVPPPITLPAGASQSADGKINITLPMSSKKDDPEGSMRMIYAMQSALWQGDEFKKHFPDEKQYRHSLIEEAESIRSMLAVAREQKISANKLSTSTKLLMELDQNGMLECWILIDHPDQGIAQDYAGYRKDHRKLLEEYIAKYDVHPM